MSKNICILFDGTWMTMKDDTSIARLYKILTKDDTQSVFYDPGVGTGNMTDKILGGGLGVGVEQNILDGYNHLKEVYDDGDKIFVFGFSRGAFTARSFVGFLNFVGLSIGSENTKDLFSIYKNKNNESANLLLRTKKTKKVDVEFLGVFDTVKSIGSPLNLTGINKLWNFHDSSVCDNTKNACQALAIDECRPNFEALVWNSCPNNCKIEQRWFCGSHCDVGGGNETETDDQYANYVLNWMVEKTKECGLKYSSGVGNVYKMGKIHDSYSSMWYGLYKFLTFNKKSIRNIDKTVPGFKIDSSVKIRWLMNKKYRPTNLKEIDVL